MVPPNQPHNPPGGGIELDKDMLAGQAISKTREIGVDDPAESTTCDHCGAWVSIAHRFAGETMTCPACSRTFRCHSWLAETP